MKQAIKFILLGGFAILLLFVLATILISKPIIPETPDFWFDFPVTEVRKVYDGDTFNFDFYMGFNISKVNERIRMLGGDAFELRDDGGPESREFTVQFLAEAVERGDLILRTKGKRDNFGRILGDVKSDEIFLNDALEAAGLTTGRFEDFGIKGM